AGRLAATDIDSSALSFKWSKADSVNHFAIHPTSGAVTVAPGSSINFEARSRYTYEAQVVDDAGNSDTAAVVITVMDDADSPSINQPASISVPELASDGTPVTDSYGRSAFRTVPVAVTDVNEPPEVSDTARSVREDAAVGTAVGGAVSALDRDENSILSFSIVSGSRGAFSIEKGGGQVRVLGQLDFETVPTYNLVVRVTDNGSPSRHADAVVTISVEDTAEPPRLAPQSVTVAESLAVGASILVLPVQDDDKSQTHTCEISKGAVGSMVTLKAAPGGSGLRLCELV
ncbi:Fat2, partial [Symbiodinium sp. KB8]